MVKQPLHIAFIGQKGIPALWGGVERATEELAVRMARSGHFVTAYCRVWYTKNQPTFFHGILLKYIPSIHTKHLDAISHTLFSIISAMWNRADVIHLQGIGPALLAWIPRVFTPRIKVFVTFHCLDRKLQKWNWIARLAFYCGEYVAVKCAHEIFTTSRALQTYVVQTWNRRTTYLPNGVFENANSHELEQELKAFNLEPYQYVICVGRLMHDKAQHETIEAFVRFKEQAGQEYADMKLVIVGDAAADGSAYREILAEQAAERTDIIFTGVQTGVCLKALMKFARTGVSQSYSEGMPLVVLELGSYGVPLILSDISAHREIFGDSHAYIQLGDIRRAAEHMERIVRGFEEIRPVAAIIADRIREHYHWDIIAARYSVALVASQTESAREEAVITARQEYSDVAL